MSVFWFSSIALIYTLLVIVLMLLLARWVGRRFAKPIHWPIVFAGFMVLMWGDTLYQKLVMKPYLCGKDDIGIQVFERVPIPPEFFNDDGSTNDEVRRHLVFGASGIYGYKPLVGRYILKQEHSIEGSLSFSRYETFQEGIWDVSSQRWIAVAKKYSLDGGYWYLQPLLTIVDANWALSRSGPGLCGVEPDLKYSDVFIKNQK